jgi:hypothetical protein
MTKINLIGTANTVRPFVPKIVSRKKKPLHPALIDAGKYCKKDAAQRHVISTLCDNKLHKLDGATGR